MSWGKTAKYTPEAYQFSEEAANPLQVPFICASLSAYSLLLLPIFLLGAALGISGGNKKNGTQSPALMGLPSCVFNTEERGEKRKKPTNQQKQQWVQSEIRCRDGPS